MAGMTDAQIVAALEQIRAGKVQGQHASDFEDHVTGLLFEGGTAAAGAMLLNLKGMKFSQVDAPELAPTVVFRSDHKDNAVIVEVEGSEDSAVVGYGPEDDIEPELQPGHQWFYELWRQLKSRKVKDPLVLAEPERTVFLIGAFEADTLNDGMGLYLSNTNGAWVKETIAALAQIGAKKSAVCLSKAVKLRRVDESWDDMRVRAATRLAGLDQKLMRDDEYLSMMTARLFGEADED